MNHPLTKSIYFLLFILCNSCGSAPTAESESTQTEMEMPLPDDFLDFLDQFHTDEDYQMAHIRWPLQGVPTMIEDSIDVATFRWTKDDWVMHKGFDTDNAEFEQSFKPFGDDMIIEQIIHINGKTGMERRFARSEDGWNLIYYAAMNFLKQ